MKDEIGLSAEQANAIGEAAGKLEQGVGHSVEDREAWIGNTFWIYLHSLALDVRCELVEKAGHKIPANQKDSTKLRRQELKRLADCFGYRPTIEDLLSRLPADATLDEETIAAIKKDIERLTA